MRASRRRAQGIHLSCPGPAEALWAPAGGAETQPWHAAGEVQGILTVTWRLTERYVLTLAYTLYQEVATCRITESLRLEKTSEIFMSNHQPITTTTTNRVPQCHIHVS